MQPGNYKKQIILGLLGLILVSASVLVSKFQGQTKQEVQIVTSNGQQPNQSPQLVAEIAGAVVSPGVYKLSSDSRVEDLIKFGGGFTADADLEVIEKTINRASIIKDGQKIYIPKKGDETRVDNQSIVVSANDNSNQTSLININTASQQELEILWGIGPVTAQNIIEQRPYSDTIELLDKKIVKSNVYERIKSQISVY